MTQVGCVSAYGLARLIGGVVDSLADPFVGHYSDRSPSPLGRWREFLIIGIVPMVVIPGLLFFQPGEPGSFSVFLYLTVMLSLYYIFFTIYVAPYLALIPEIARTERHRVELSRPRSLIGGPIIMAFGILWLVGVDVFKDMGMDAMTGPAVPYFARVILGRDEGFAAMLSLAMLPYGLLTPSSPGEPGDEVNLTVIVGLTALKGLPIAAIMSDLLSAHGRSAEEPLGCC